VAKKQESVIPHVRVSTSRLPLWHNGQEARYRNSTRS